MRRYTKRPARRYLENLAKLHGPRVVAFPATTKTCDGCGAPCQFGWHELCDECFHGARLLAAAIDYHDARRRP